MENKRRDPIGDWKMEIGNYLINGKPFAEVRVAGISNPAIINISNAARTFAAFSFDACASGQIPNK